MSYNTRSTDFLLRMKRELKLDDTQMETLSKAYSESITKVKEEAKAEAKAELIAEEKAKAKAKAEAKARAKAEKDSKFLEWTHTTREAMKKVSRDKLYPKFSVTFQELTWIKSVKIKYSDYEYDKESYICMESSREETSPNGEKHPFCQLYPFVFSRYKYEEYGDLQIVGYTCDLSNSKINSSDFKKEWHPMMDDFIKFYQEQYDVSLSSDIHNDKRKVKKRWDSIIKRYEAKKQAESITEEYDLEEYDLDLEDPEWDDLRCKDNITEEEVAFIEEMKIWGW